MEMSRKELFERATRICSMRNKAESVAHDELAKIGDELRKIRTDSGKGLRKVAAVLGISQTQVARIESGAISSPDLVSEYLDAVGNGK